MVLKRWRAEAGPAAEARPASYCEGLTSQDQPGVTGCAAGRGPTPVSRIWGFLHFFPSFFLFVFWDFM